MRTSGSRPRRCAPRRAGSRRTWVWGRLRSRIRCHWRPWYWRRRASRRRAALAEICASDVHARASHAWGKSYADVVRGFRGSFEHPPDFVAYPRDEREVERLLEWCSAERVAAIPYGGGTSVVGGRATRGGFLLQRCDRARPGRSGAGARGRSDLPRGAHPGGRQRTRSGAPARRARPDAASLPAVVRALDPRGLDRHARGGALRDGVDAHRGLRRVRARDHAQRGRGSRAGCRAPARG